MLPQKHLALVLALVAPAAHADDIPTPSAFTERLIEKTIEMEGEDAPFFHDEYAAHLLLEDPASIYSDLKTASSKDISPAWQAAVRGFRITAQQSFVLYAHQVGLTKARPGIDVIPSAAFSHDLHGYPHSPSTVANLTKAAVDPDIYRAAIFALGYRQSALAATYAVGAQVLRDALSMVESTEDAARLDLRQDVLDRFVALKETDLLGEGDAEYLQDVFHAEVKSMSGGASLRYGVTYVPAQFRAARLAAAYHEQTGKFAGIPCTPEGLRNGDRAGTRMGSDTRDICASDATDQAVYAWYLDQYRDQASGIMRYPDKEYVSTLALFMKAYAVISEVAGIGSFINYTTALRSAVRSTVPAKAPPAMRKAILKTKCRF